MHLNYFPKVASRSYSEYMNVLRCILPYPQYLNWSLIYLIMTNVTDRWKKGPLKKVPEKKGGRKVKKHLRLAGSFYAGFVQFFQSATLRQRKED